MKVSAIIPAAGSGERFGEAKQFKLLAGRPMLFHTLQPFLRSDAIDEVIVVVPGDDVHSTHRDVLSMSAGKPVKVVAGGSRRQDSVKRGVDASDPDSTLVCIHDAARPFVTEDLIQNSISACENADSENLTGTDESALMEAMGFSVTLIEGNTNNFKITTMDDWERAEQVLNSTLRQTQGTMGS